MLFEIQVTENEVTETRYTRDGAFYINPMNDDQVMLTTVDGHPVLGRNGNPIVFSSEFDNIDISETGMVTIQQGNLTFSIGEINVVTANRPRLLEAIGANQFRLPNLEQLGMVESDIMQDTAPGLEVLQSHTLERSNVQLAEEFLALVDEIGTSGWIVLSGSILAILLGLVAIFLLRQNKHPKAAGIILLATAVISTFMTFFLGFIGGIIYVITGIMALVRKPKLKEI